MQYLLVCGGEPGEMDRLALECRVWDAPWDPSVPYGTDGMEWTSGPG